jgi:hypothetical protein
MKKDVPPAKFRVSSGVITPYVWKHYDENLENVYDRDFYTRLEFENFLSDRWGNKFAKKVLKDYDLLEGKK